MEGAVERKKESVTWQETRYSTRGDLDWILELRDTQLHVLQPDQTVSRAAVCCVVAGRVSNDVSTLVFPHK